VNFVAVKMLTGDRSKYVGLIFAISVASMLMTHQASIFGNIMWRTTSQIRDVRDAEIRVMDPRLRSVDEIEPLSDNDLYRVRGVEGVEWAVRLYKGATRMKSPEGRMRAVVLMGMDDATLVGAPRTHVSPGPLGPDGGRRLLHQRGLDAPRAGYLLHPVRDRPPEPMGARGRLDADPGGRVQGAGRTATDRCG